MKRKCRISRERVAAQCALMRLAISAPHIQEQIGLRPPTELTEYEKKHPEKPSVRRKKMKLLLFKHARAGEFNE